MQWQRITDFLVMGTPLFCLLENVLARDLLVRLTSLVPYVFFKGIKKPPLCIRGRLFVGISLASLDPTWSIFHP